MSKIHEIIGTMGFEQGLEGRVAESLKNQQGGVDDCLQNCTADKPCRGCWEAALIYALVRDLWMRKR